MPQRLRYPVQGLSLLMCLLTVGFSHSAEPALLALGSLSPSEYRWGGAEFAFCFISDDGTVCNLGWAQKARDMGFRFTIAMNEEKDEWRNLTADSLLSLWEQGFEIANYSRSHGFTGLLDTCPIPPRGPCWGISNAKVILS